MISTILPLAVPPFEVAIKFVDQLIQDFVGVAPFSRSDEVRAADFDVTGCRVMMLVALVLILIESEIDADDVLVVPKQDGELFINDAPHRIRHFEVHRLDV